ncbi:MAG TPA: nuclear transport factor 2 family protein [Chitinophagaceae bacterium]|nr:nuclear transport factor 2 family protein [Chitinophagaceae bacterium]
MKPIIFFLLLTMPFFSFSQQTNDSMAIAQLLKDDYRTLETWDIGKHVANCTENYILIENGEILSLADEIKYFKKNKSRIITRKDTFNFKCIRVKGNTSYSAYYLKSDITENGNVKTYNWAESAIFRKIKGKWKIELIHSTEIKH